MAKKLFLHVGLALFMLVSVAWAQEEQTIPPDFTFQRDLKITDYNEGVIHLQTILKSEGLFCKECKSTDYFGSATRRGVFEFQRKFGLKSTGIVDQATRAKLNQILLLPRLRDQIAGIQAQIAVLQAQLTILPSSAPAPAAVPAPAPSPPPPPPPPPPPVADITPPSAITNLAALGRTTSSVTLSWTAPGDDGNTGTAASYDLRYTTPRILSNDNWASATQATLEPTPKAAGSLETMSVSGLSKDTNYYFAIKTKDEVPNESALSNVTSDTTLTIPAPAGALPAGPATTSSNVGGGGVAPAPPPPSPPPPQCQRLASGKQTYFVSTKNMPQIMQVDLDPFNVQSGAAQTVSVKIRDTNNNPITTVQGTVNIDAGSINFSFSFVSGTNINGTWQGTWSPSSSICKTYTIQIKATSASGQSTIDLSFL